MKTTKIICAITNIMFAITTFVFYVLVIGTIRVTDITIKARDMIDNNIVSVFSDVFVAAYVFAIVLTSVIIVAQFICIVHSLFQAVNLKRTELLRPVYQV